MKKDKSLKTIYITHKGQKKMGKYKYKGGVMLDANDLAGIEVALNNQYSIEHEYKSTGFLRCPEILKTIKKIKELVYNDNMKGNL